MKLGRDPRVLLESHAATQIRTPTSHRFPIDLIEKNVQLVISQVKK